MDEHHSQGWSANVQMTGIITTHKDGLYPVSAIIADHTDCIDHQRYFHVASGLNLD